MNSFLMSIIKIIKIIRKNIYTLYNKLYISVAFEKCGFFLISTFGFSIDLGFSSVSPISISFGFSETLSTGFGFWILVLLFNVCNSNFNLFNCSSNLLSTLRPELEVFGFDFSCSFYIFFYRAF